MRCLAGLLLCACASPSTPPPEAAPAPSTTATPYADPVRPPKRHLGRASVEMYSLPREPTCLRFPLGDADGQGARKTQEFQSARKHLGEDWVVDGAKSRGAPIHAITGGYVTDAYDYGSAGPEEGCWGRVVRIVHRLDEGEHVWVESLYAHLLTIDVELGQRVERGQVIGTVGDAGCSGDHLHWELRDSMTLPLGHGYGSDTTGYVEPSVYVAARRCEDPA